MNDYQQQCQAITELSGLIQAGDVVTLRSGNSYVAAGHPQNHDTQRWQWAWLVSCLMDTCWIRVNLLAVVAVARDGQCLWTVDSERLPVQQMLF